MIAYVTGLLGSGKSLYAVRKIARKLLAGGVVATNIELGSHPKYPEWWKELLKHAPYYRLCRDPEKRWQYEVELVRRYYYEPDIKLLMAARIKGRGESRGLMVIDEAHNEISARRWEVENQAKALKKLTLSRKRGFDVLIVTQDMDNTDVAARRLTGVEIRVINWRHWAKVPFSDASILPFNFFLAQTFPTKKARDIGKSTTKRIKAEPYLVGWYGRLYNTAQDYELEDELAEDGVRGIWLPVDPEVAKAVVGAPPAGGPRPRPDARIPGKGVQSRALSLFSIPGFSSRPKH